MMYWCCPPGELSHLKSKLAWSCKQHRVVARAIGHMCADAQAAALDNCMDTESCRTWWQRTVLWAKFPLMALGTLGSHHENTRSLQGWLQCWFSLLFCCCSCLFVGFFVFCFVFSPVVTALEETGRTQELKMAWQSAGRSQPVGSWLHQRMQCISCAWGQSYQQLSYWGEMKIHSLWIFVSVRRAL